MYFQKALAGCIGWVFSAGALAASSGYAMETGLGAEYGGLGTQLHFPSPVDYLDPFISAGVIYVSSRAGEQIGGGAGLNYFASKQHAMTIYGGVLAAETTLTDDMRFEREPRYGVSLGYKYFFSKPAKSGFVVGGTYNILREGSYPMVSLGYRF